MSRFVQIAVLADSPNNDATLFALRDDGTIWVRDLSFSLSYDGPEAWRVMPALPDLPAQASQSQPTLEAVIDHLAKRAVKGELGPENLAWCIAALCGDAVAAVSVREQVEALPRYNVGEDDYGSKMVSALEGRWLSRLDVLALFAGGSRVLGAHPDSVRLDWLETQTFWSLAKTDESDNNGVGLKDSAVYLTSDHPDGRQFPTSCESSIRDAIDKAAALDSAAAPTGEAKP